ncbi:MAG: DUF4625 domain-containing protein [Bacteroidota bacterium]
MKVLPALSVIVLILLAAACQKEDAPQVDLSAPVIDIVEPLNEQQLTSGQQVRLLVRIEENQELHDYSVIVRNEDRSFNQTLAGGHLHTTAHLIDQYFDLPELTQQTYTITVKAADHNGNFAAEQVVLYVP